MISVQLSWVEFGAVCYFGFPFFKVDDRDRALEGGGFHSRRICVCVCECVRFRSRYQLGGTVSSWNVSYLIVVALVKRWNVMNLIIEIVDRHWSLLRPLTSRLASSIQSFLVFFLLWEGDNDTEDSMHVRLIEYVNCQSEFTAYNDDEDSERNIPPLHNQSINIQMNENQ